ncbi:hypothetical protein PENPOL_c005G10077 [Penicillium polonicum]|uniref:Azaphilone pigments biosynthesis cluster protein L N-terminal domain-containing protein n=1 Tax=Penicillium polonicum TaxID=60169 RepID=A0A1V6NN75_PENPO|nr:hypothetical protein PENPOL_c005G10077 [Penicillium polonicum]
MADPFSIATGTIGIAAVAAQSIAALWRDIKAIQDAPRVLLDLESDLCAVERVLSTLQLESNASLLEELMPEVQDGVKLAISNCQRACNKFQTLLGKWKKHSTSNTMHWWDRVRVVLFGEAHIQILRQQLFQSQETLLAAITTANLIVAVGSSRVMAETKDTIESHEQNLIKAIANLNVVIDQIHQQQQILPVALPGGQPVQAIPLEELTSELENGVAVLTSSRRTFEGLLSATTQLKSQQRFSGIQITDDSRALLGIMNPSPGSSQITQSISNISIVRGGRGIIGVANNLDINKFFD